MKSLPSIAMTVLLMFLLAVCPADAEQRAGQFPDGGALNYGEYGRPATLDPITSNDMISLRITELIYNGLVGIDEKQEIIPELAERWEIAEEGKIYTFYLRQDVPGTPERMRSLCR